MPVAANPFVQPRQPWIAGLMSLALPGWGQFYNGQVHRAIWCFLAFSLLLLPGSAVLALAVPPTLMLPALALGAVLSLGLWAYAVAQAVRVARRSAAHVCEPWQTSGAYALVFVTCGLLVLPTLTIAMRGHLVQPFRIPSASMAPSLLPGDLVFADMHYNCPHCRAVQRGDVAIFTYPNDRTLYYVKRIVGLPGDQLRIANHQVYVNGVVLAPPSPEPEGGKGQTDVSVVADTDIRLAPGHVFLLGDNRAASTDSRQFGTVPLADVVGRVRQIWFSRGDAGVRWGRIGELVR